MGKSATALLLVLLAWSSHAAEEVFFARLDVQQAVLVSAECGDTPAPCDPSSDRLGEAWVQYNSATQSLTFQVIINVPSSSKCVRSGAGNPCVRFARMSKLGCTSNCRASTWLPFTGNITRYAEAEYNVQLGTSRPLPNMDQVQGRLFDSDDVDALRGGLLQITVEYSEGKAVAGVLLPIDTERFYIEGAPAVLTEARIEAWPSLDIGQGSYPVRYEVGLQRGAGEVTVKLGDTILGSGNTTVLTGVAWMPSGSAAALQSGSLKLSVGNVVRDVVRWVPTAVHLLALLQPQQLRSTTVSPTPSVTVRALAVRLSSTILDITFFPPEGAAQMTLHAGHPWSSPPGEPLATIAPSGALRWLLRTPTLTPTLTASSTHSVPLSQGTAANLPESTIEAILSGNAFLTADGPGARGQLLPFRQPPTISTAFVGSGILRFMDTGVGYAILDGWGPGKTLDSSAKCPSGGCVELWLDGGPVSRFGKRWKGLGGIVRWGLVESVRARAVSIPAEADSFGRGTNVDSVPIEKAEVGHLKTRVFRATLETEPPSNHSGTVVVQVTPPTGTGGEWKVVLDVAHNISEKCSNPAGCVTLWAVTRGATDTLLARVKGTDKLAWQAEVVPGDLGPGASFVALVAFLRTGMVAVRVASKTKPDGLLAGHVYPDEPVVTSMGMVAAPYATSAVQDEVRGVVQVAVHPSTFQVWHSIALSPPPLCPAASPCVVISSSSQTLLTIVPQGAPAAPAAVTQATPPCSVDVVCDLCTGRGFAEVAVGSATTAVYRVPLDTPTSVKLFRAYVQDKEARFWGQITIEVTGTVAEFKVAHSLTECKRAGGCLLLQKLAGEDENDWVRLDSSQRSSLSGNVTVSEADLQDFKWGRVQFVVHGPTGRRGVALVIPDEPGDTFTASLLSEVDEGEAEVGVVHHPGLRQLEVGFASTKSLNQASMTFLGERLGAGPGTFSTWMKGESAGFPTSSSTLLSLEGLTIQVQGDRTYTGQLRKEGVAGGSLFTCSSGEGLKLTLNGNMQLVLESSFVACLGCSYEIAVGRGSSEGPRVLGLLQGTPSAQLSHAILRLLASGFAYYQVRNATGPVFACQLVRKGAELSMASGPLMPVGIAAQNRTVDGSPFKVDAAGQLPSNSYGIMVLSLWPSGIAAFQLVHSLESSKDCPFAGDGCIFLTAPDTHRIPLVKGAVSTRNGTALPGTALLTGVTQALRIRMGHYRVVVATADHPNGEIEAVVHSSRGSILRVSWGLGTPMVSEALAGGQVEVTLADTRLETTVALPFLPSAGVDILCGGNKISTVAPGDTKSEGPITREGLHCMRLGRGEAVVVDKSVTVARGVLLPSTAPRVHLDGEVDGAYVVPPALPSIASGKVHAALAVSSGLVMTVEARLVQAVDNTQGCGADLEADSCVSIRRAGYGLAGEPLLPLLPPGAWQSGYAVATWTITPASEGSLLELAASLLRDEVHIQLGRTARGQLHSHPQLGTSLKNSQDGRPTDIVLEMGSGLELVVDRESGMGTFLVRNSSWGCSGDCIEVVPTDSRALATPPALHTFRMGAPVDIPHHLLLAMISGCCSVLVEGRGPHRIRLMQPREEYIIECHPAYSPSSHTSNNMSCLGTLRVDLSSRVADVSVAVSDGLNASEAVLAVQDPAKPSLDGARIAAVPCDDSSGRCEGTTVLSAFTLSLLGEGSIVLAVGNGTGKVWQPSAGRTGSGMVSPLNLLDVVQRGSRGEWRGVLEPGQEIAPLGGGKGVATVALASDGSREMNITAIHELVNPVPCPSPPCTHIHAGPPGRDGAVLYPVEGLDSPVQGRLAGPLPTPVLRALRGAWLYVNIHTADAPKGRLRGQLLPAVPPVAVFFGQTQEDTMPRPVAMQVHLSILPAMGFLLRMEAAFNASASNPVTAIDVALPTRRIASATVPGGGYLGELSVAEVQAAQTAGVMVTCNLTVRGGEGFAVQANGAPCAGACSELEAVLRPYNEVPPFFPSCDGHEKDACIARPACAWSERCVEVEGHGTFTVTESSRELTWDVRHNFADPVVQLPKISPRHSTPHGTVTELCGVDRHPGCAFLALGEAAAWQGNQRVGQEGAVLMSIAAERGDAESPMKGASQPLDPVVAWGLMHGHVYANIVSEDFPGVTGGLMRGQVLPTAESVQTLRFRAQITGDSSGFLTADFFPGTGVTAGVGILRYTVRHQLQSCPEEGCFAIVSDDRRFHLHPTSTAPPSPFTSEVQLPSDVLFALSTDAAKAVFLTPEGRPAGEGMVVPRNPPSNRQWAPADFDPPTPTIPYTATEDGGSGFPAWAIALTLGLLAALGLCAAAAFFVIGSMMRKKKALQARAIPKDLTAEALGESLLYRSDPVEMLDDTSRGGQQAEQPKLCPAIPSSLSEECGTDDPAPGKKEGAELRVPTLLLPSASLSLTLDPIAAKPEGSVASGEGARYPRLLGGDEELAALRADHQVQEHRLEVIRRNNDLLDHHLDSLRLQLESREEQIQQKHEENRRLEKMVGIAKQGYDLSSLL